MKTVKFMPGHYRVVSDDKFAHIHKDGRKWYATIRALNGDLIRYAGIWNTLKDAIEESERLLRQ